MHFWQLKSFWHAAKLCKEDVESHSFEEIATVPPLSVPEDGLDGGTDVSLVVNEMKAFKRSFQVIAFNYEIFLYAAGLLNFCAGVACRRDRSWIFLAQKD